MAWTMHPFFAPTGKAEHEAFLHKDFYVSQEIFSEIKKQHQEANSTGNTFRNKTYKERLNFNSSHYV